MFYRVLSAVARWLFPPPFGECPGCWKCSEAAYRREMLAWQDAQRGRCGPPWAWSDPAFRSECVRACREDR